MAKTKASRKAGKASPGQPVIPDVPESVKLTVRVSGDTAQRLAIASTMLRESQSAIVDRVLGEYLRQFRMPSLIASPIVSAGESSASGD